MRVHYMSNDPFKLLHPDVHELILQHFNSKDVLRSSLVSLLWYQLTASSKKCLGKLHLNICREDKPPPFFDTYDKFRYKFKTIEHDLKSPREYQSIALQNIAEIFDQIVKVLSYRKWKKVFISQNHFKSRFDLHNIIGVFEEYVEDLHMKDTSYESGYIEYAPRCFRPFHFPHLIKLELDNSDVMLAKKMFDNCDKLKTLVLRSVAYIKEQQWAVEDLLYDNSQLEVLVLQNVDIRFIFQPARLRNQKFTLKTFILNNDEKLKDKGFPYLFRHTKRLLNFLESQVHCLNKLELGDCCSTEGLSVILKLPKLTELKITFIYYGDDVSMLDFVQNSSIKTLDFNYYKCEYDTSILCAFFDAMPKLQFLDMNYIDNDILSLIGPRCKNVERLTVQQFIATSISSPEFFPNIDGFNLHLKSKIFKEIMDELKNKPYDQLTSFELQFATASIQH